MLAALIATHQPLSIITTSLPPGIVALPYSVLVMASGGMLPYTWTVISGALPAGLTLNANTGVISGIPTVGGTSIFTVQVKDFLGATAVAILTLVTVAVLFGDQFVAATTTFTCIFLAKRAAFLSTNPALSYPLFFSGQGSESIIDHLTRLYRNILGPLSSTSWGAHFTGLRGGSLPPVMGPPVTSTYLSDQIIAVIVVATQLNAMILSLPVAPVNAVKLADMQQRMGVALRLLHSLAIPIYLNFT